MPKSIFSIPFPINYHHLSNCCQIDEFLNCIEAVKGYQLLKGSLTYIIDNMLFEGRCAIVEDNRETCYMPISGFTLLIPNQKIVYMDKRKRCARFNLEKQYCEAHHDQYIPSKTRRYLEIQFITFFNHRFIDFSKLTDQEIVCKEGSILKINQQSNKKTIGCYNQLRNSFKCIEYNEITGNCQKCDKQFSINSLTGQCEQTTLSNCLKFIVANSQLFCIECEKQYIRAHSECFPLKNECIRFSKSGECSECKYPFYGHICEKVFTQIEFCEEYSKENGICYSCDKDYYFEQNKCIKRTKKVENCLKYESRSEFCFYCEKNYYLQLNACIKIKKNPNDVNCERYDEYRNKCIYCESGYYLQEIQSEGEKCVKICEQYGYYKVTQGNSHICLPLQDINCLEGMNETGFCLKCKESNYYIKPYDPFCYKIVQEGCRQFVFNEVKNDFECEECSYFQDRYFIMKKYSKSSKLNYCKADESGCASYKNDQCVYCIFNFVFDITTQECFEPNDSTYFCKKSQGKLKCIECMEGAELNNDSCYNKPQFSLFQKGNQRGSFRIYQCPSQIKQNDNSFHQCMHICPIGSFIDSFKSNCQSCEVLTKQRGCEICFLDICMKCKEGYLLKDFLCQYQCFNGSWVSAKEECIEICASQNSMCTDCTSSYYWMDWQCIKTCPNDTLKVGKRCFKKIENCNYHYKTDLQIRRELALFCERCNDYFPYFDRDLMRCVKNCPYFISKGNVCKKYCFGFVNGQTCTSSCSNYYTIYEYEHQKDVKVCIDTCNPDYYKYFDDENLCTNDCMEGYYKHVDKKVCIKCNAQNCKRCDGNPNICSSCKFGLLNEEKKCYFKCSNGEDRYLEQECNNCVLKNCKICRNNKCLQCNEGFELQDTNGESSCSCITHPNNKNFCYACSDNCQKCDKDGQCLKCELGYFLQRNIFTSIIECLATCPKEYKAMIWDGQCKYYCPTNNSLLNYKNECPCKDSNCINCENDILICEICKNDYYLVNGECLQCNISISNCLKCQKNQCVECLQDYGLYQNQCRPWCKDGRLVDNFNRCNNSQESFCKIERCIQCILDENQKEICLKCQQSYLHLNQCQKDYCPEGYFEVNNSLVCKKCPPNCLRCSSSGSCINCRLSYYLEGEECLLCSDKESNCSACKNNKQNHTECTDCFKNYVLYQSKCMLLCKNGQLADDLINCKNNDEKKPSLVQSCTQWIISPKFEYYCLKCQNQYFLHYGTCNEDCPEGYFKNKQFVCQRCPYYCLTCSSSDLCLSCQNKATLPLNRCNCEENKVVLRNKCVEQCPKSYELQGQVCELFCNPGMYPVQIQNSEAFECQEVKQSSDLYCSKHLVSLAILIRKDIYCKDKTICIGIYNTPEICYTFSLAGKSLNIPYKFISQDLNRVILQGDISIYDINFQDNVACGLRFCYLFLEIFYLNTIQYRFRIKTDEWFQQIRNLEILKSNFPKVLDNICEFCDFPTDKTVSSMFEIECETNTNCNQNMIFIMNKTSEIEITHQFFQFEIILPHSLFIKQIKNDGTEIQILIDDFYIDNTQKGQIKYILKEEQLHQGELKIVSKYSNDLLININGDFNLIDTQQQLDFKYSQINFIIIVNEEQTPKSYQAQEEMETESNNNQQKIDDRKSFLFYICLVIVILLLLAIIIIWVYKKIFMKRNLMQHIRHDDENEQQYSQTQEQNQNKDLNNSKQSQNVNIHTQDIHYKEKQTYEQQKRIIDMENQVVKEQSINTK